VPDNAEMQKVAREGALLAGGARAILLQIAHPAVGRGVAEHSDFATRPLDRLRATLTYVYCVTFGTPEEIEAVTQAVTAAHRKVTGTGYRATDPELQLWVAATLYDTALLVHQEMFGPLDPAMADKVYEQYAVLGTALQVPAGMWPADRGAFGLYWQRMVDSLQVSADAKRVALELLSSEVAPLLLKPTTSLNRFLTAAWLPPPIREQYGLAWDEGAQRRYDLLMRFGSPLYRVLPVPLREAPKTYYLRQMRRRKIGGMRRVGRAGGRSLNLFLLVVSRGSPCRLVRVVRAPTTSWWWAGTPVACRWPSPPSRAGSGGSGSSSRRRRWPTPS
jgi:uncharacterized protein (DUF2236 family)